MTAFFVKTEQSSAGPFTGVELREAALAGIVGPDTPIGASPTGPWTKAEYAGLFSEKRIPLPHPPDTHVPQYQVRGMQGSLTGPFKLRELIGFAARGMLPDDVHLKSDVSEEWISLNRIPVLVACLSGNLVLLGEARKVNVPAHDSSSKQGRSLDITASSASSSSRAWRGTPGVKQQADSKVLLVGDQGLVIEEDEAADEYVDPVEPVEGAESEAEEVETKRRFSLPAFPSLRLALPKSIPPRLLVNGLCLLLAIAGIGAAYSYWKNMGMSPGEIVGDWMGGGNGVPAFGITFRADMNCVIFNAQGESWAGDYQWAAFSGDDEGFSELEPFTAEIDRVEAGHQVAPVLATDGYIRLRGFVDQPPMIGGHRIADCFLRRDGDKLRIGYPATVRWSKTEKSMEAGWFELVPLSPQRSADTIIADLKGMEVEDRPVKGYSVEKAPHISKAIAELEKSQERDALDGDVGNGSICFSVKVNGDYLLRTYGIPDEARPAYPFEIPQLKRAQSFEGSQVVRYGVLKLFLRPDGTIQYVSIML